jgi:hypothetical protein
MGSSGYMARLGCLLRVLCAIDRRMSGSSTIAGQDRIHRVRRGTYGSAGRGLLPEG